MSTTPFVIVPFGGPGAGKSTLSNFLVDGRDSGKFLASDTCEGSETKQVTSHTNWVLGDSSLKKKVQVFDVPGLGAPDLPLEDFVDEIKKGISDKQNIDMALLVLKASDKRLSIEQLISIKVLCQFLESLKPENVFMVFTHCDSPDKPKADWFAKKLESINKQSQV